MTKIIKVHEQDFVPQKNNSKIRKNAVSDKLMFIRRKKLNVFVNLHSLLYSVSRFMSPFFLLCPFLSCYRGRGKKGRETPYNQQTSLRYFALLKPLVGRFRLRTAFTITNMLI